MLLQYYSNNQLHIRLWVFAHYDIFGVDKQREKDLCGCLSKFQTCAEEKAWVRKKSCRGEKKVCFGGGRGVVGARKWKHDTRYTLDSAVAVALSKKYCKGNGCS